MRTTSCSMCNEKKMSRSAERTHQVFLPHVRRVLSFATQRKVLEKKRHILTQLAAYHRPF